MAKPLRGHGYVALADERVVPRELAELVRSPLFQDQMTEELDRYRTSDLRKASIARMREEMIAAPDMAQSIAPIRNLAALRADAWAVEGVDEKESGQVIDLKTRRQQADKDHTGEEAADANRRKRRVALAADLELPPAVRRALAAAKAQTKAVEGMFAEALETGLRIEAKGKAVSVADMATGRDKGLAGAVAERLRTIPQAQLDLIYVQTREAARPWLLRERDEGAVLAMKMLETEYRMRRMEPVADDSLRGRFMEKFGKLIEKKQSHIDRLHQNVVQEKMMRERVGKGDISFLRIEPGDETGVRRVIEIWSRGMREENQAKFANALSQRGVPDRIIQETLKVAPVSVEAEQEQQAEASAVARLAAAKGAGR